MSLRLGRQAEGKFEVKGYEETTKQTQGQLSFCRTPPLSIIIIMIIILFMLRHGHTALQSNLIKRHNTKSKSNPQQYLKW